MSVAESIQEIAGSVQTIAENEQKVYDAGFNAGKNESGGGTVDKSRIIKQIIDIRKNAQYLFCSPDGWRAPSDLTDELVDELIKYDVTENATNINYMFQNCDKVTRIPSFSTEAIGKTAGVLSHASFVFCGCAKLKEPPMLDLSNVVSISNLFQSCLELITVPLYDTSKVTNVQQCFYADKSLKIIPAWDLRSCSNYNAFINNCSALEEIWIKNIKANIVVGQGTTWGHLLTQESALSLCFQCRKTEAMKTITFAAPVYDALEPLYVKLVEITDEMRAEDDLIDEKYPFELCESTDDGAMTIATYMTNKMWAIARG